MRLLIDAGNTRLKWRVDRQGKVIQAGACLSESRDWLDDLVPYASTIDRVAVSTVVSEARRRLLEEQLRLVTDVEICFYWSEAGRGGLINAYSDVGKMGADRWHAMYAAWRRKSEGLVVIDAGSAITVDYVSGDGRHLGGFILPGKQMMLRSLQSDAARIGFESLDAKTGHPGTSTTECVQQGVVWLWEGLVQRLIADCRQYSLNSIVCTGGDAPALLACGLLASHDPDLVLAGLAAIDSESTGL